MEQFLQLDTYLLLWINGHQTAWLNDVMWSVSQAATWIPLYAWLIYILYRMYGPKFDIEENQKNYWILFALAIATIAISAGLSDFASSGILKKTICRLRPSQDPLVAPLVQLVNGYTGGRYGFPSSHAANCWAVAVSFLLLQRSAIYKQPKALQWLNVVLIIGYALINCYSRMYLGVHYPLDILCGTAIGIIIAFAMNYLFSYTYTRLLHLHK